MGKLIYRKQKRWLGSREMQRSDLGLIIRENGNMAYLGHSVEGRFATQVRLERRFLFGDFL